MFGSSNKRKPVQALSELAQLPGYDEVRHRSTMVVETVEVRNGQRVVVYRTRQDITRAALESYRNPSPSR